jgi:hypothetical protein
LLTYCDQPRATAAVETPYSSSKRAGKRIATISWRVGQGSEHADTDAGTALARSA